ncbi:glycosyltransferase family 2 protein [uncultured Clostridium sp.]|uniref:glycosyltransferase family 2 protein n=1 Tax=uncultured Clostridium sp. TaxID=59620 RepID=UPI0025E76D27|nr:glycosyltransferase family 2 protein [uncultured Clostridium sp.]
MKLISIVVPVYNVEKYLKKCVLSLINQTYKNIEIILVNDGSTDGSGELCKKLSSLDKRIKIVNKKNQGLGLARNTGLEYVTGEFVTFIDSDDYADEKLIEDLYSVIAKYQCDTCIGGFKRVDNTGKVLFKESYENYIYNKEEIINILLARMLGSSPEKSDAIRMSVWNVLYSMDIIRQNNLSFCSEREFISEDIIFNTEYYKFAKKVAVINSCSYNYRVNEESLTMKYKVNRFEMCRSLYNELYRRIEKIYPDNNEVKYRLQRQYFVNIRVCLKQENKKVSKLGINKRVENIKRITCDKQLNEIIMKYPKYKMGIKQQVFLYLIRSKKNITLEMLNKFNLL